MLGRVSNGVFSRLTEIWKKIRHILFRYEVDRNVRESRNEVNVLWCFYPLVLLSRNEV